MSQPSASNMERAELCAGSFALPQVYREGDSFASQGDAVHDFLVNARLEGREEALAKVLDPEHHRFCAAINLDALPQGGRYEIAMAWDPDTDTARVLGENIGRAYREHGLRPHEVAGTADLAGVVRDTGVVVDWKSGFRDLGDPRESAQLATLALMVSRIFKVSKVIVSYFYLRDDGSFRPREAVFDSFDLADTVDRLHGILERVYAARDQARAGRVPNVATGQHCRYCTAFDHCPAKATLALQLASPVPALAPPGGVPGVALTPAQAGVAWERVREAEQVLDRIKGSLKEYAQRTPFRTPGGLVVREVQWPDTEVVADVAHSVLEKEYGLVVANEAAPRVTSLARVKRALSGVATARKMKLAPLLREVSAAIEGAGGITKTTSPQVRAMKGDEACDG